MARAVNGNIDYAGDLARSGRYEFVSHSGDIRLMLSGGTGFEVQANSFSGNVRSEFPVNRRGGRGRRRRRHPEGHPGSIWRCKRDAGAARVQRQHLDRAAIVRERPVFFLPAESLMISPATPAPVTSRNPDSIMRRRMLAQNARSLCRPCGSDPGVRGGVRQRQHADDAVAEPGARTSARAGTRTGACAGPDASTRARRRRLRRRRCRRSRFRRRECSHSRRRPAR